ncbi:MAG: hypothetical protein J6S67_18980 [Methanobrevibacter sp.]|nr:hypothetical protein [Methanobrevibacter sp.]
MLNTFKFWCCKVLPLVYDDSLSYYEVLCKVVDYINKLIEQDNVFADEIEALKEDIAIIKKWIEDFDTDVAEQIIREALAKLTSVFFTSTIPSEEGEIPDATAILNDMIANHNVKEILVDKDIIISGIVAVKSGLTIKGMGGTVYQTDSNTARFYATGSDGALIDTSSSTIQRGNRSFDVSRPNLFEVGKRYKIIGIENNYDLDTVGAQNWLGMGTDPGMFAYGAMEFICKEISGNTIYMDRTAPWYIGTDAKIYETGDIENVTFDSLKIEATSYAIWIQNCNNISVNNCVINCHGRNPLIFYRIYDSEITNCTITNHASTGQTYQYNTIRFTHAVNVKIDSNVINGGYQCIDIANDIYVSADNIISNNVISAGTHDSLTTHPAVVNTVIIGNKCSGDIALRSKGQQVVGNIVDGEISIGDRCCDNTVITGNTVKNTIPIRLAYGSWNSTPLDRVYITNNVFVDCSYAIGGTINSTGDGSPTSYKTLDMVFSNNIVKAHGTQELCILRLTGSSAGTTINPPFYRLIISGNTFTGYSHLKLTENAGDYKSIETARLYITNNTFNVAQGELSFNGDSTKITNAFVDNNSMSFSDALSTAKVYNYGDEFPANGIKGEMFFKSDGTFGFYDGTNWRYVTTQQYVPQSP